MNRQIQAVSGSVRGARSRPFACIASGVLAVLAMIFAFLAAPLSAQDSLESFDPDRAYEAPAGQADAGESDAIDADLGRRPAQAGPRPVPDAPTEVETSRAGGFDDELGDYGAAEPQGNARGVPAEDLPGWVGEEQGEAAAAQSGETAESAEASGQAAPAPAPDVEPGTYGEDDLIGAAEGVFGKGAEGLAKLIEDLLEDQGRPNGYIVGREAGGAFIVGARYGSGTLHHKIEGQRKVYWTGPSIGFDAGANASNTFVLVYNLFDTEDLYERFPSGEGQAYFVGGLTASYLRRGDIVLIPIRLGAGLRLGINAGYMKFSKKQKWLPF